MEQVGLNLIADLFSDKGSASISAGDPGNSLFRSLLEKSATASKGGTLFDEKGKGREALEEGSDAGGFTTPLENMIRRIGLPLSQLKLPRSALPELMSLLEKQGLQKSEIQTLIASVSDKDGSIRMDRLLARLQKTNKTGRADKELLLEGKDIPQIGEALMAMGIGVGKIKEIIEGSLNQKGELSLDRLSGSLNRLSPGMDAKSVLSALLERSQIQGFQKGERKNAADPDVNKLVKEFAEAPAEDMQKKIKEEIGRLMREKGAPPQEVKSFLEGLTPTQAGVLSKKSIGIDPDGKKGEAEARELIEKVVLGPDRKVQKDEWRDKLLQSLQKEKGIGKETQDKSHFPEEAVSKPNPADQAKLGELKIKVNPVEPLHGSEPKGKSLSDQVEVAGTRKEKSSETKPALVREGVTADLSAVRIQKEAPEATAINRVKDAVALPEPLPKILDRMLWMIQGGEQKGRIQISPPELGRLDLDLIVKNGHLQAQVSAENPQVKDLLEANLNQLKQHLSDIGLIVDRFEVSIGLEQNPFARDQTWTAGHRRGQSSKKEPEDDAPLRVDPPLLGRMGVSLSQVDMLV
jgi:hypothetical protein